MRGYALLRNARGRELPLHPRAFQSYHELAETKKSPHTKTYGQGSEFSHLKEVENFSGVQTVSVSLESLIAAEESAWKDVDAAVKALDDLFRKPHTSNVSQALEQLKDALLRALRRAHDAADAVDDMEVTLEANKRRRKRRKRNRNRAIMWLDRTLTFALSLAIDLSLNAAVAESVQKLTPRTDHDSLEVSL